MLLDEPPVVTTNTSSPSSDTSRILSALLLSTLPQRLSHRQSDAKYFCRCGDRRSISAKMSSVRSMKYWAMNLVGVIGSNRELSRHASVQMEIREQQSGVRWGPVPCRSIKHWQPSQAIQKPAGNRPSLVAAGVSRLESLPVQDA